MATSESSPTPTLRAGKRVVVPKVWKRPHSTIYGKNVEFGNSLYSDKIGELNGRKFNSDLPWNVRNSPGASAGALGGSYNQGYLSNLYLIDASDYGFGFERPRALREHLTLEGAERGNEYRLCTYADLLAMTNPAKFRGQQSHLGRHSGRRPTRQAAHRKPDFYEQYGHLLASKSSRLGDRSRLLAGQLAALQRRPLAHDNELEFAPEVGVFVPKGGSYSLDPLVSSGHGASSGSSSSSSSSSFATLPVSSLDINHRPSSRIASPNHTPIDHSYYPTACPTTSPAPYSHYMTPTQRLQSTERQLPSVTQPCDATHLAGAVAKTKLQIASSPYGQSIDGRKLSVSSINPASYRPSLPQKTTTAQTSDGDDIELHDKSSPFYTDRWAGRTIRHFDSDLYSNANLFKSMIL